MTSPHRTLVLGGTRSGKSAWAELLVTGPLPVTYVATAPPRPDDPEWASRLATHRARRPAGWGTVQTGTSVPALPAALATAERSGTVLVDDLGAWLTLALDATDAWQHPDGAARVDTVTDELLAQVVACAARLVLVSPEVGLAVVPATRAGRVFADAQGTLNARLAAACDEVVLVVAGLPLWVKGTRPAG